MVELFLMVNNSLVCVKYGLRFVLTFTAVLLIAVLTTTAVVQSQDTQEEFPEDFVAISMKTNGVVQTVGTGDYNAPISTSELLFEQKFDGNGALILPTLTFNGLDYTPESTSNGGESEDFGHPADSIDVSIGLVGSSLLGNSYAVQAGDVECEDGVCRLIVKVEMNAPDDTLDRENQFSIDFEFDGLAFLDFGAGTGEGRSNIGLSKRGEKDGVWSAEYFFATSCELSGAVGTASRETIRILDTDEGKPGIQNGNMEYAITEAPILQDGTFGTPVPLPDADVTINRDAPTERVAPGDTPGPTNPDNKVTSVEFNTRPGYIYRFVVNNIDTNNTLEVDTGKLTLTNVNDCNQPVPTLTLTDKCIEGVRIYTIEATYPGAGSRNFIIQADFGGGITQDFTSSSVSSDSVPSISTTNQSADTSVIELTYPENWKTNTPDSLIILDAGGEFIDTVSLNSDPCPWDCTHSGHPDYPCPIDCSIPGHPDYPCLPSCQDFKPSFGTSLYGRSFPIYIDFIPPDPSRLYDVEVSVSGPSLPKRTVYTTIDNKGPTLKRYQVPLVPSPGPGMHDYTWEIDWRFAVGTETSREAAWNTWRSAHKGWAVGDTPLGSEPADAGPEPSPKWGPWHTDLVSPAVPPVPPTPPQPPPPGSPPGTPGTPGSPGIPGSPAVYTPRHRHETPAWLAWRARKSAWAAWAGGIPYGRPSEPGFPNPMNMGSWPVSPGNPYIYNYRSSTRDDGDGATASYSESGTGGRFDQSFGHHPRSAVFKLAICKSKQLVIIPPTCGGVSGNAANVGETKSVTNVTYNNPNTPSVATLNSRTVGFTIPSANYHAGVSGRSGNKPLPPGGSRIYNGSPTRHNLPGDYSADWSLGWWIIWGDPPGTWPYVIDRLMSEPAVPCSGSGVHIFAEPPTCSVQFWEYEVEDPRTIIKVILTNPNRVPIAVDVADYTIQYSPVRNGSSNPSLNPPAASASAHFLTSTTTYSSNNSAGVGKYYVPENGGQLTLFSNGEPYPLPERYDYSWQVNTFLGIESWNTSPSLSRAHPSRTAEFIHKGAGRSCSETLRLAYLPYIKAYEGGVAAGGRFGTGIGYDACESEASIIGTKATPPILALGQIFGFRKADGDNSAGASSEYALRAFGQITGYYSASQRDDYGQIPDGFNQPHLGLSFSNNNSLDDGGNYGAGTNPMDSFANRRCIAHYWSTFEHARDQITDIATSPLDISDDSLVPAGSKLYHNGDLTIFSTNNINPEINTAIFTKGDLYITSDIYNNEHAIWSSTNRLGVSTIYLITKGNVFIDKDVRRIDAIIIALPPDDDPTTDGTVYTCSDTSQTTIFSNHHQVCSKQLTINGAVIARSIILGRTNGSRNLGHPFEHPQPLLQANPTVPNADNVAEIFYFSPEYYVALPVASFIESQVDPNQYYRSDSIISLPPLF